PPQQLPHLFAVLRHEKAHGRKNQAILRAEIVMRQPLRHARVPGDVTNGHIQRSTCMDRFDGRLYAFAAANRVHSDRGHDRRSLVFIERLFNKKACIDRNFVAGSVPVSKRRTGRRTMMRTILTAIAMAAASCLPAFAAEPESCATVRFSDVGWTDITAT